VLAPFHERVAQLATGDPSASKLGNDARGAFVSFRPSVNRLKNREGVSVAESRALYETVKLVPGDDG
jgi:hypothetical protein